MNEAFTVDVSALNRETARTYWRAYASETQALAGEENGGHHSPFVCSL